METDKRTVQTSDIGLIFGVGLRLSNTCELYAEKVASLEGLLAERDKTIAELTNLNKRLIDEKNAYVAAQSHGTDDGNGIETRQGV